MGRSPGAAVAATEDPAAEVPSLDRQALLARAQAQNPTILLHRSQVLVSERSHKALWVVADVYESDAAWVVAGQSATVELDSVPGQIQEAKVDYV